MALAEEVDKYVAQLHHCLLKSRTLFSIIIHF